VHAHIANSEGQGTRFARVTASPRRSSESTDPGTRAATERMRERGKRERGRNIGYNQRKKRQRGCTGWRAVGHVSAALT